MKYLGHLLIPEGIRPNSDCASAVQDYPVPKCVKEVRQFLGLAPHYRCFMKNFTKIAQQLHSLRRVHCLVGPPECEGVLQQLKQKLIESPILRYMYIDFNKNFILETDVSALGLGAVLSQQAEDNIVHPVAYASHSLSPQEKQYESWRVLQLSGQ